MSVYYSSLSDVLKNPIRRKIILHLYQKSGVSYVDLMNLVAVNNTGKFKYHLKILADLIEKDENGKYNLSDKGRLAAQFLQKFDGKESEPTSLQWGDAALIGFAGCVVACANPSFWAGSLCASFGIIVPVPVLLTLILLGYGFAFIAPGATMRFLAIRRAKSHDLYDLSNLCSLDSFF